MYACSYVIYHNNTTTTNEQRTCRYSGILFELFIWLNAINYLKFRGKKTSQTPFDPWKYHVLNLHRMIFYTLLRQYEYILKALPDHWQYYLHHNWYSGCGAREGSLPSNLILLQFCKSNFEFRYSNRKMVNWTLIRRFRVFRFRWIFIWRFIFRFNRIFVKFEAHKHCIISECKKNSQPVSDIKMSSRKVRPVQPINIS